VSRTEVAALRAEEPDLAPWRAFLHAHARVARRLDEDLQIGHALSLQEYETLLHLAEAPGRRLRMGRLADSLLLSKSGATRLVDRLVDDGLVERTTCSSDARGAEAALTGSGLARLRAAAPTHMAGIRDYFFGAVQLADLPAVERAMSAIADQFCSATACLHAVATDEADSREDADPGAQGSTPSRIAART